MAARVLVAYATKMGSTGEIAETIAEVLRDAGHEAAAAPVRTIRTLDDWDAVVLGSALYAAHWQHDANRFVARLLAPLQARPVWLFSSGPLDRRLADADLPIAPHAAEVVAQVAYRGHRTFGGRLDPEQPGVDAQILATHQIGDFRDWAAIRAWAAAIARELAAGDATGSQPGP